MCGPERFVDSMRWVAAAIVNLFFLIIEESLWLAFWTILLMYGIIPAWSWFDSTTFGALRLWGPKYWSVSTIASILFVHSIFLEISRFKNAWSYRKAAKWIFIVIDFTVILAGIPAVITHEGDKPFEWILGYFGYRDPWTNMISHIMMAASIRIGHNAVTFFQCGKPMEWKDFGVDKKDDGPPEAKETTTATVCAV